MILLSILIRTLPERKAFLKELMTNLYTAMPVHIAVQVEILTDDRGREITAGQKCNDLLQRARGKYTWFVDDDDYIYPAAIPAIISALEKGPDVVGINGIMTTDGAMPVEWEIRLGHPYEEVQRNGKPYYLRFPNHITPMRRDLAMQVKFEHKTYGEDYAWALALNNAGLLKTQEVVDMPVYHYKFRTVK